MHTKRSSLALSALGLVLIGALGAACSAANTDGTSSTGAGEGGNNEGGATSSPSSTQSSTGTGSTSTGFEAGVGGGTEECLVESAVGERKALDMIVLLDRSGSMAGSLWDGSIAALGDFFTDPASTDIRAAMSFFPKAGAPDACDPNAYNPPVVPLTELSTNSADLVTAMAATSPAGDYTPVYGAMYGSLQWATLHQDDNPDRVVVLVFASDGDPTQCNTSISAIAQIAQTAREYNGLRTFAVAIAGATVSNLDQIAAAGGTTQAIDITSDVAAFQTAMEEIRGAVLGCEFDIPPPEEDEFDPLKLNVQYAPDAETEGDTIPQVPDPEDCGTSEGWYYDDPAAPSKILLCPGSCSDVQTNAEAQITFAFGCPTVIAE